MNDNPMPDDERALPEWLQRESDRIRAEEARDRAWIGVALLVLIAVAVIAFNAWLRTMGYGA